jgi:hypothetical protein
VRSLTYINLGEICNSRNFCCVLADLQKIPRSIKLDLFKSSPPWPKI